MTEVGKVLIIILRKINILFPLKIAFLFETFRKYNFLVFDCFFVLYIHFFLLIFV